MPITNLYSKCRINDLMNKVSFMRNTKTMKKSSLTTLWGLLKALSLIQHICKTYDEAFVINILLGPLLVIEITRVSKVEW